MWLGRAVGSGEWAESLVEFVDAAKASGQPHAVANLSFDLTQQNLDGSVTTRTALTPQEEAALQYARDNQVLVVVAAGNQNGEMSALGQASQQFDNVVSVGAVAGESRASYASYGKGLDVVADGGTPENPVVSKLGDRTVAMAGTSVATAKVTGAVAQIWAANPDLNYQQVADILQQTSKDLGEQGWDAQTGNGAVDVDKAIALAKTTSGATELKPQEVAGEKPALANPELMAESGAIALERAAGAGGAAGGAGGGMGGGAGSSGSSGSGGGGSGSGLSSGLSSGSGSTFGSSSTFNSTSSAFSSGAGSTFSSSSTSGIGGTLSSLGNSYNSGSSLSSSYNSNSGSGSSLVSSMATSLNNSPFGSMYNANGSLNDAGKKAVSNAGLSSLYQSSSFSDPLVRNTLLSGAPSTSTTTSSTSSSSASGAFSNYGSTSWNSTNNAASSTLSYSDTYKPVESTTPSLGGGAAGMNDLTTSRVISTNRIDSPFSGIDAGVLDQAISKGADLRALADAVAGGANSSDVLSPFLNGAAPAANAVTTSDPSVALTTPAIDPNANNQTGGAVADQTQPSDTNTNNGTIAAGASQVFNNSNDRTGGAIADQTQPSDTNTNNVAIAAGAAQVFNNSNDQTGGAIADVNLQPAEPNNDPGTGAVANFTPTNVVTTSEPTANLDPAIQAVQDVANAAVINVPVQNDPNAFDPLKPIQDIANTTIDVGTGFGYQTWKNNTSIVHPITDQITPFAPEMRDAIEKDPSVAFRVGQAGADVVGIVQGVIEMGGGITTTAGGVGLTAGSGTLAAPVSIPVTAAGVATTVHGASVLQSSIDNLGQLFGGNNQQPDLGNNQVLYSRNSSPTNNQGTKNVISNEERQALIEQRKEVQTRLDAAKATGDEQAALQERYNRNSITRTLKGDTPLTFDEYAPKAQQMKGNREGGNFYTEHVLDQKLFDNYASNRVELQVPMKAPNGTSVQPDYVFYGKSGNGKITAIGDAKAGEIKFDDQAKGLISAATQTTRRELTFYTPTGKTDIPRQLQQLADTNKVTIKQVRVPYE